MPHSHGWGPGAEETGAGLQLDFNISVPLLTRWSAHNDTEPAWEQRSDAKAPSWEEMLEFFGVRVQECERMTVGQLCTYGPFLMFCQGILEQQAHDFVAWEVDYPKPDFQWVAEEMGVSPRQILAWIRVGAAACLANQDDVVAYFQVMVEAIFEGAHPLLAQRSMAQKAYIIGRCFAVHVANEMPLVDFNNPEAFLDGKGIELSWNPRLPDFWLDGEWNDDETVLLEVWEVNYS